MPKDLVHNDPGPVRNDDFLEITPEHFLGAPLNPCQAEGPVAEKLRPQPVIASNGSLEDLGEKGHEQGIAVRSVFAPVNINEVAHGLDGIKGDAQGKQKLPLGKGGSQ